MTDAHASTGFSYSQSQFQELIDQTLKVARQLGASSAGAEVSEGCGLSVSVRKGDIENVERNRDKSLGVSVYIGKKRGNASTSDFSEKAIRQTVQAAMDIAKFTAEDPAAGLPDEADLARPQDIAADLDLFHPWDIDTSAAATLARRCEAAAMAVDPRITNSEGAAVSAQQSHFYMGNSLGFRGGYPSSRHSLSVAPIASVRKGKVEDMQRDAWYSSELCADWLASPESVGRYAADRALARLHGRKIDTCEVPVLFEAPLAAGLLGALAQALNGGALYRKASFLCESLGKQVLAEHLDVVENPHLRHGRASAFFDHEGVRTAPRTWVEAGVVQGYLLTSYSARKLGMKTTGNAGGSRNLSLVSRLTQPRDDLNAMIRKLHRGLLVTELMGQGVNYVTGDYSRGAAGYWVEDGRIAYPVHEVTIAGNILDMFKGIVAVGSDVYVTGSKSTGSVLIDRMMVAGH